MTEQQPPEVTEESDSDTRVSTVDRKPMLTKKKTTQDSEHPLLISSIKAQQKAVLDVTGSRPTSDRSAKDKDSHLQLSTNVKRKIGVIGGHIATFAKLQCPLVSCGRVCQGRSAYTQHMVSQHFWCLEVLYNCPAPDCQYVCNGKESINKHINHKHPFQSVGMRRLLDFNIHLRGFYADNPGKIVQCPFNCVDRGLHGSRLLEHMIDRHDYQPCLELDCMVYFNSGKMAQRHKRQCHELEAMFQEDTVDSLEISIETKMPERRRTKMSKGEIEKVDTEVPGEVSDVEIVTSKDDTDEKFEISIESKMPVRHQDVPKTLITKVKAENVDAGDTQGLGEMADIQSAYEYSCLCGVRFDTMTAYNTHVIQSHGTSDLIKCGIRGCRQVFRGKSNLHEHHKKDHGLGSDAQSNLLMQAALKRLLPKCTARVYLTPLEKMKPSTMAGQHERMNVGKDVYTCRCGQRFDTQDAYDTHAEIHDPEACRAKGEACTDWRRRSTCGKPHYFCGKLRCDSSFDTMELRAQHERQTHNIIERNIGEDGKMRYLPTSP